MPIILAFWHGQHLLAPMARQIQSPRQYAGVAPPRRRGQCHRRAAARRRHHPRLGQSRRRLRAQGRRRRVSGDGRFARGGLVHRAVGGRAQSRARCRPRHHQARAGLRPADLSERDRDQPALRAQQLGPHYDQSAVRPRRRRRRRAAHAFRADADDAALEAARQLLEERLNAATRRAYDAIWSDQVRAAGRAHGCSARAWPCRHTSAAGLAPLSVGVGRRIAGGAATCWRGVSSAARNIPSALAERRGEASLQRPPGPLIWVHGASVGEMLAAVPLIERLRAQDFAVLVTSGTVTSAALAEQRLPDGAHPSIHSARCAAFCRTLSRSLAARPGAVRRIRSVAQSHSGMRRTQNSDDRDQRPAVGALVHPLAARAGAIIGAAAALRSVPGAIGRRRASATPQLGAPRVSCRPAISSSTCRRRRSTKRRCGACKRSSATGPSSPRHRRIRARKPPSSLRIGGCARNFRSLLTVIVPRHPERGPKHRRDRRSRAACPSRCARAASCRCRISASISPTRSANSA